MELMTQVEEEVGKREVDTECRDDAGSYLVLVVGVTLISLLTFKADKKKTGGNQGSTF